MNYPSDLAREESGNEERLIRDVGYGRCAAQGSPPEVCPRALFYQWMSIGGWLPGLRVLSARGAAGDVGYVD